MSLVDHVHIARRFQRAIRIDFDVRDPKALEGFVCPESSANVLLSMGHQVAETGQGAFTWTGPYGGGKSSLVVALSALLNGRRELRVAASQVLGKRTSDQLLELLPPRSKGWLALPVVGRRDDPVAVIGEALDASGFLPKRKNTRKWTEQHLIENLLAVSAEHPRAGGGLIVYVDEMGKFLEAAAQQSADVYIFQLLAEAASRSNRRLIFIGILHQAFEEYAHRLSREMRDEWSKIQGRFADLPVNAAGEEQIELLSKAIITNHAKKNLGGSPQAVVDVVRKNRPGISDRLTHTLENCWPLHPVVACLLGPISRRRFGQNQRSLFGFLNSAEPQGFQDFLKEAEDHTLYEPHRLWDYLRINLEPSILASQDGHRWALAVDAIERCEALGGDDLRIRLCKTIALIDLFKERSGLVPAKHILELCFRSYKKKDVKAALDQLSKWSLIIFKRFQNAYAVYAGSDFDIEQAVGAALQEFHEVDFKALKALAGLQPVLAKRHYYETGAFRWLDVDVAPLAGIKETVEAFDSEENPSIGQFVLAIPIAGETEDQAKKLCRDAVRQVNHRDIAVGLSQRGWMITELAKGLLAIEKVRVDRSELSGDAVARREVEARLAFVSTQLEEELHRAFDDAMWHLKHYSDKKLTLSSLNSLASELMDKRFHNTPQIHNELLNRMKPSSSAIAAQNVLLRRMVMNEGKERLGIEGYPAEGGLFASLLDATGLYRQQGSQWKFMPPMKGNGDTCRLAPIWQAAVELLKDNVHRTVAVKEIYERWKSVPYGVKDGLLPVLSVAFILSYRDQVAFYRQGIFQANFKDLDVEYLANDSGDIQLRWMNLTEISSRLLSEMAEVVRHLDHSKMLVHLEPIDVARGLIAIYEDLPSWTKRTMRLSANAIRIRNLFKQAKDPNKFLFDDMPGLLGAEGDILTEQGIQDVIEHVREGLEELHDAYRNMLARLKDELLEELQVPNMSPQALAELRERAENIKQLSGDFKLNAFIGRLTQFTGRQEDVEGILSLAANKPTRDWVDADLDQAALEVADLAQRFNKTETYARVQGRSDKRHAMAVIVAKGGRPTPMIEEFNISDTESKEVTALVSQFDATLQESNHHQKNIILAALAELSARYMSNGTEKSVTGSHKTQKKSKRVASR